MTAIPTIPSFTDGTAPSLSDLNALSACASFVADNGVRPLWHFTRRSTQAVTANTWTNVSPTTKVYDDDAVFSAGSALIVTQGYYACEGCVAVENTATTYMVSASFLLTAGANNPHLATGSTNRFGLKGSSTTGTGLDTALVASDICPIACYPGDSIQFMVFATAAATQNFNQNNSFSQGRFSTQFTGWYLRTGS